MTTESTLTANLAGASRDFFAMKPDAADAPSLLKRSPLIALLILAWPVLLEHVLFMLVGFCDTWLTGRFLEEQHLAAVMLMNYTLWLLLDVGLFISIGATALIARFTGAGDRRLAAAATDQALLLAAILGAAAAVAAYLGAEAAPRLLGLEAEPARLAARYVRVLAIAMPAVMFETVGIACLRGVGDMRAALYSMTILNVVNIALGAGLLLGVGPLPALGWDGLAIGTAAGHLAAAAYVLTLLVRGRSGLKLSRGVLRPDGELIRRTLRIGVPGGLDHLFTVLAHLAYVAVINTQGTAAAAAHGVAVRIESLSYLSGAAFQLAAMTLVGQYLGAGRPDAARRAGWSALAAGGIVMLAAGALFATAPRFLVELFLRPDETEIAALGARLLLITSVSMPAIAIHGILAGALRGAGDSRWPFVVNLCGLFGVRLPLAWLFVAGLGYGAPGAYYAAVVDHALRALVIFTRYRSGQWEGSRV